VTPELAALVQEAASGHTVTGGTGDHRSSQAVTGEDTGELPPFLFERISRPSDGIPADRKTGPL
jgi:hypothetical protein